MTFLLTEWAAHLAFWVIVGLTIVGSCIAVLPHNIVYNVLGLVVALTGVAGLFLHLGSFFVALMQLLIYVGAICVVIVFAIMVSRPLHLAAPKRRPPKVALAVASSVLFFLATLGVAFKTVWVPALERSSDWSVAAIGHLFLTRYNLVFEAISLVLLVAIIGAILTAGYSRRLSS
jgi:NADH-quinone oxidoreductase subunit J